MKFDVEILRTDTAAKRVLHRAVLDALSEKAAARQADILLDDWVERGAKSVRVFNSRREASVSARVISGVTIRRAVRPRPWAVPEFPDLRRDGHRYGILRYRHYHSTDWPAKFAYELAQVTLAREGVE
jgi:hypothetical protein